MVECYHRGAQIDVGGRLDGQTFSVQALARRHRDRGLPLRILKSVSLARIWKPGAQSLNLAPRRQRLGGGLPRRGGPGLLVGPRLADSPGGRVEWVAGLG